MPYTLRVLNVGDGACTVLSSSLGHRERDLAVIDCGVRQGSPKQAGRHLADTVAHLGPALLSSVVVSHFDVDHWWGLRHFGEDSRVRGQVSELDLYYPAMPCVVPAGVLAFVSRGPYGVAPVDLRQRLEAAIAPGGHLRATALVRGDAVTLAGETFEVLWPPADLLVDDHPFLARAVAGVRKLAAQIPELEENLTAVEAELRESLDPSGRRRDSIDHEQTTRDVDTEELGRPFEDSGNDGYDVPSVNDEEDGEYIDGPKPVNIPPELRDTFTKVYSDIRKANNDLSLILASRSGHLVCYGDADGPGLEQAAADLVGTRFFVSLAPHHGTHRIPSIAWSALCVAQAGKHHRHSWHLHRNSPPHSDNCINLDDSGDLRIRVPNDWPWW